MRVDQARRVGIHNAANSVDLGFLVGHELRHFADNRPGARDAGHVCEAGVGQAKSEHQVAEGLAGLAAYSTQQRAKETAIRKVLGASVPNIIGLLSLNMIKVIALSIIPAIVGTYYISNIWLERFSYRAELSSMPYLLAVTIVGIFSISILVSQTYRTAQANPVSRLKYE